MQTFRTTGKKKWFVDFGGVQLTRCQLYKCKCGWIRGWRSFCSPYRYLSLITAFCPTHGLQVLFFPSFLAFEQFPAPVSGVLVAMPPLLSPVQVPPLPSPCPPCSWPTLGQTIRGYTGVFQPRPVHSVVPGLVRDPHMLRSHTR